MKNNQTGFSAIEILLVLVVIGLIGVVGWLVYDRQKSTVDTQQTAIQTNKQSTNVVQQETQTTIKCDGSFKELKNEKIGIAFCYPESWKTEIMDTASNHIVGTVTLTSPDYKDIQEGYGGSNSGSRVSVNVYSIDKLGASYTPISKILDNSHDSAFTYTDVKSAKIAGKDGVSYIIAYEGPRKLENTFEYKGNKYSIVLEEDINGPNFNDNQDLYQKIVNSFQLLSN